MSDKDSLETKIQRMRDEIGPNAAELVENVVGVAMQSSALQIATKQIVELKTENKRLRDAIQAELDNVITDGWINREALEKALQEEQEDENSYT